MGVRITKTIINELVKIKGESIWSAYKSVENHHKSDDKIAGWINIILNTPNSGVQKPAVGTGDKQEEKNVAEAV